MSKIARFLSYFLQKMTNFAPQKTFSSIFNIKKVYGKKCIAVGESRLSA